MLVYFSHSHVTPIYLLVEKFKPLNYKSNKNSVTASQDVTNDAIKDRQVNTL